MSKQATYKPTIGLEIHAQLRTHTKAYSAEENIYGAKPNTKTSPITLGHPGTLPMINKKVIEYAIKMGLAVNANITIRNEYARKNYFYADLPKGYQITQDTTPICTGGYIEIKAKDGSFKKIQLTRIHMEEDAGKSIHNLDPFNSLIDLNRAGVPLIEIVSEPEINSAKEASSYINEVRKLMKYLEICDGNMEEGSLRCDANISVANIKDVKLGTKVEVKNMNSTRNVRKAIEFEIQRQIQILEKGEKVIQETRSFNDLTGSTVSMRSKEDAHDYRYFPEPDIQPVIISEKYIKDIKENLPPLPRELLNRFIKNYNLSDYDASIIIEDKDIAFYFDELCNKTKNYKAAANLINGEVKSYLNENAKTIQEFPLTTQQLAELITLIESNKISHSIATKKIFPEMLKKQISAEEIAVKNNWIQESNDSTLYEYVNQIIKQYPDKVLEYKNGKKGLIGLFMGEIMKLSKGKADPKLTNEILRKELEK
ncbi:MAG: Asp-tRNA(Asn)/Glu-tRNA(Gln) amidotransferase subunit GatB [Bacteroidota bacterium]|nr:Asp-tRNA(Asn)/Glu-tRNA(Gln) amidotransferase subunit GatB [Bacteroidota bacterium]